MYCRYCGTQLDDTALYCSRCGKPAQIDAAAPTGSVLPQAPPRNDLQLLSGQIRTLGILWAIYSPLRLLMSIGIFLGRISTRVWMHTWPQDIDFNPHPLMRLMHGIFLFSGVLSLVTGILGICAAAALLSRSRSGRSIALVAAFLALISIPFGTALGIYTLVVLLPQSAAQNYERLAIPA